MKTEKLPTFAAMALAVFTALCIRAQAQEGMELSWKDAGKETLSQSEDRTLVFAGAVASIREEMSMKANAIHFWMSKSSQAAWHWREIEDELAPQQITDFFMGAIPMTGSQGNKEAVWALYNPWWDTILFLNLKANFEYVPEYNSTKDKKAPLMIENLVLVSGETLRREAQENSNMDIAHNTAIPKDETLSDALWRATAGSVAAFEKLLPIERRASFSPVLDLIEGIDKTREWERIQLRSVLRLKQAQFLINDHDLLMQAKKFRHALAAGSVERLDTLFNDPSSSVLLETFKEMPGMFRSDFQIYGAIPTPKGTLFIYLNRKFPRLYATVTSRNENGAEMNALEWYDLTLSGELHALSMSAEGKEVAE